MSTRVNAVNLPNDALLRAYTGATGGSSVPPNGLINAGMNFNQGATSYTVTNAANQRTLDNYVAKVSSGSWIISQVAGSTTGSYYLNATTSSAPANGNTCYITANIPSRFMQNWAGQPVSIALSTIWPASLLAGTSLFTVGGYYGTGTTDSNLLITSGNRAGSLTSTYFGASAQQPTVVVPSSATGVQTYQVNLGTLPAATTQITIYFIFQYTAAVSSAENWRINNLYCGPTSAPVYTPLDYRLDYERCQMLYQKTYAYNVAPATNNSPGYQVFPAVGYAGNAIQAGQVYGNAQFFVPMLYTPRVSMYSYVSSMLNSASFYSSGNTSTITDSSVSNNAYAANITADGFLVQNNTSGTLIGQIPNTFNHWVADCTLLS